MPWWLPVYTRAEGLRRRSEMPTSSAAVSSLTVLGLVLALAPAPSSLALPADVSHLHHHHRVDLDQWSERRPGDVRCYCNLPACITTGYMCKSVGKGCFSDLVDHVDVYRARHGCLDLLDGDRQKQCKNQPRPDPADADADDVLPWDQDAVVQQEAADAVQQDNNVVPSRPAQARMQQDVPSLLLCCTEDMCNHIDSPDSRMRNSGLNGSDASHVTMSNPAGVPLQPGMSAGSSEAAAAAAAAARSTELWFKAATIAVPICGALILVLLIALAVRLLRADSQHQRASKLSACAFPPLSDKKVPLLPCGTGVGWGHGVNCLGPDCPPPPLKNHTLAKLNYSASYDLLDLHKEDNHHHHHHHQQHHNNNRQHNVLGSSLSSGKSSYKQVLASFVPWGSSNSSSNDDPPTNV